MKFKLTLVSLLFPCIVFAQAEGEEMAMMAKEAPIIASEAPEMAREMEAAGNTMQMAVGGLRDQGIRLPPAPPLPPPPQQVIQQLFGNGPPSIGDIFGSIF
ncbi:hypothetical protein G6717_02255 [Polynucleobacter paneuropaeus]|nr:hypothetical protein [Polynucleobacter paneuropaeus]